MSKFNNIFGYVAMALLAICSALNFQLIILPNDFAPSGIDGICTMIEHLIGTNIGYLSLAVNIPLFIAAIFFLKKSFVIKTGIFFTTFSLAMIFFGDVLDLSALHYISDTSPILSPIAGGVVRGAIYFVTIKYEGSSGGIDIIAEIVKKFNPHYNLMNILFAINTSIAIGAFFVFGSFDAAISSIVYSFVTSTVSKSIQSAKKERVRVEIITSDANILCDRITNSLKLPATILDAHGAYSGSDKKMVICVTTKDNVSKIESALIDFPDAVTFESTVSNSIIHGH